MRETERVRLRDRRSTGRKLRDHRDGHIGLREDRVRNILCVRFRERRRSHLGQRPMRTRTDERLVDVRERVNDCCEQQQDGEKLPHDSLR
jgi:hypothetical protein